MRGKECMRVAGLAAGLVACSFDAGNQSDTDADMIGEGETQTLGSSSTGAPTDPSVDAGGGTSTSTTDGSGPPPTSTASDTLDTGGADEDTDTDVTPTGSTGSQGEGPLVDEGVVVRYFLDEAAAGTAPTVVLDSTDAPFDLPIDYMGDGLSYTEVGGNRGLLWSATGLDAGARAPLVGSELQGLDDVKSVTVEVVFRLDGVMNQGSRIVHVGEGSAPGRLTLSSPAVDELEFAWNDSLVRTWPVPGLLGTRHVAHVVVDTLAPNEDDRVRLVLDGAEVLPDAASTIEQGETIKLGESPIFALGNRDRDRSLQGVLFYAAVYGGALGDDAIEQNVAALLLADDG